MMEILYGREFDSVDEAKVVIDATAMALGFSLVKQRVRPNSIELCCSKGRKYSSEASSAIPDDERRASSSQKTDCPYRLVIGRKNALSCWIIRRTRNDSANVHNHGFLPPGAHSVYRNKAILKRKDDIIRLYNAGIRPTQILTKIQLEDAEDVKGLTRYDVYNTIRRHRHEELAGRTEMEWLYNQLQNQDAYYYQDQRDQENQLAALFIAPRSSIKLFSRFPMVLFMDYTYKTNKFDMPLFNITGITSFKKSFQVAAIFLTGETQAHYT